MGEKWTWKLKFRREKVPEPSPVISTSESVGVPRYDISAFKSPLQSHSDHKEKTNKNKLMQVGEEKDFIVRRIEFWHDDEQMFGDISLEKRAALMRQAFSEFHTLSGISVVPVEYVVALDEHEQKKLFAYVPNITPKEMSHEEHHQMMVELFEKLITYYEQKAQSGAPFIWDINKPRQYVYGTLNGNKDAELYLVDVDPHIREGSKILSQEINELENEMEKIIRETERTEDESLLQFLPRIRLLRQKLNLS